MLGQQSKRKLPDEIDAQLVGMVSSGSSTIPLLAFAIISTPTLWWRTHDVYIGLASGMALVLNLCRISLEFHLKRSDRRETLPNSPIVSTTAFAIMGLLSLSLAVLVARSVVIGDVMSILLTTTATSAYVIGVIAVASPAPQLASFSLLVLFAPLIGLAAVGNDRGYLVVAILLAIFCLACLRLSRSVYERLCAQLLAERQLSLLAKTDYLTGLSNRSHFEANATLLLEEARAGRKAYVLMLVDLDHFKPVNDSYGHAAGDNLLKLASARIKSALGDRHLISRLGGDEFAVACDPGTSLNEVRALGHAIVEALARPFLIGEQTITISGSLGIAALEGSDDTVASILERADKALYRAKTSGRNQAKHLGPGDTALNIVSPILAGTVEGPPRYDNALQGGV